MNPVILFSVSCLAVERKKSFKRRKWAQGRQPSASTGWVKGKGEQEKDPQKSELGVQCEYKMTGILNYFSLHIRGSLHLTAVGGN